MMTNNSEKKATTSHRIAAEHSLSEMEGEDGKKEEMPKMRFRQDR